MPPTRSSRATWCWWLPVLFAHALVATPPVDGPPTASAGTAAPMQEPQVPVARVRAVDPVARLLLEHGARLSPTIARQLRELEASDLFVYVETGFLGVKAAIRFATATPHGRYVRITIETPDLECRMIAELAHELEHAVEIAGTPDIRDSASLTRFYRAEGVRTPGGYCSRRAQRIGPSVLYEVTSGEGLRARLSK